MLKPLYLAELVLLNLKYIATNTSLMMSLSVNISIMDSKFTIRFNPTFYICNRSLLPFKF